MENKKDKKVALNDELLDKVSGGEDGENNGTCECGAPLAPGGVCMNPLCSHSNTNSPVINEAVDVVTEIVGHITFS